MVLLHFLYFFGDFLRNEIQNNTISIIYFKSHTESLFTSQSHESLHPAIIIAANVVGQQVLDVVHVVGKPHC